VSYLPLIAMLKRRSAELTRRAEVTSDVAATGESSSAGIELDLIQDEMEHLAAFGRELLSQRRAALQAIARPTKT
jgi:hypothetical protein